MPINSRAKGASGERELCEYLRKNYGVSARRAQQYRGTKDSADLITDWDYFAAIECKRVQLLNIDKAMEKAVEDSGDRTPVVFHRKNGKPWLVTLRAEDLVKFASHVFLHNHEGEKIEERNEGGKNQKIVAGDKPNTSRNRKGARGKTC